MGHILKRAVLLLGLGALLAGCHTAPATFLPEESTRFSLENTEKLQLLDAVAEAAVACTGLQERIDAAGRLEVVAALRNRGTEALALQARCVFRTAAGRPMGEDPGWRPLQLAAGATETVRYVAAEPLAARFTLLVRSAR